ncbi:hypothetical protein RFI_20925 [Reticulomyxa filosa]|uniref:phosphoethanolamine N-methyltransferase n=1 Tax=Reticulomyxa filosa TaxID=46433 RepID=X6MR09_RETFI|nr:hypothetical protein RFI_20925 [Reticulomyxa filosa]|eukprot:ETO16413.1 hypothetical protein RFI_20925 [Reticulomyxa filosa]
MFRFDRIKKKGLKAEAIFFNIRLKFQNKINKRESWLEMFLIFYLWPCKHCSKDQKSATQDFLDTQQYAIQSVLRYERMFGENFVSTGGLETTAHFTSLLDLTRGQKVLDVGCGIGGSAFHMAKTYGVNVHGIDLSKNMVHIAEERCKTLTFPKDITFEICDATTKEYPENSFDVIYSRDAILHIFDKLTLFRVLCLAESLLLSQFYKWLKPGGKVFITDYCWGSKPHSEKFVDYVKQRGYHLLTVTEYGKTLEWAGLINVVARDVTIEFMQVLRRELKHFSSEEQKKKILEGI